MSIIITFGTGGGARPTVEVSPLSELLATLHVLAEPEHHGEHATWVATVRSTWSEALHTEFGYFSPLWSRYRCRAFYPVQPASDVTSLREISEPTLLLMLKRGILGSSRSSIGATDAEYVHLCAMRSQARGELAHHLVATPQQFVERLHELMEQLTANYFEAAWQQVREALAAEAERLTRSLHEFDVKTVLTTLHTSISETPSGTGIRIDKLQNLELQVGPAPLVIVPSMYASPHVIVKSERNAPWVLQYPIASSRERDMPQALSLKQLHDRLAALLAPSHMEVCRHVLAEPMTTTAIAERMHTSPQHVSRALKALREVDLIRSERNGKYVYHRLDVQALQRLGPDVLATIMR